MDADVFFQAWSSLCSDLFVQFLEKKNFSVISYSTISIRFLSVDAVVSFCELNNLNNFLKLHVEHLITADLFFQFLEKHSMLPLWMRMLFFGKLHNFPKRCMRNSSCISFAPPLMSARGIAAVSALSGTGVGIQRNCCGRFFMFSFCLFSAKNR